MAITRLGDPRPRTKPSALGAAFVPSVTTRSYLPVPRGVRRTDLFSALRARRTRRTFARPALEQISALLWYSARTQGAWTDEFGERREWRPAPSAGACHPHDLMLVRRKGARWQGFLYNSRAHALDRLECRQRGLIALVNAVQRVVPTRRAVMVIIIGFPERTSRFYTAPESLLWRDAGALLGVMSVVASGLKLAFCPLGITCEPYVSRLLGSRGRALGFGGALVGGLVASQLGSAKLDALAPTQLIRVQATN